jgi:hypothetical protein
MPGQQTISTKENVPDVAPPKRGRRASDHASSAPGFQVAEPVAPFTQAPPVNLPVAEPVAPFTQAPPVNDTGNQEVGQTQVKYGPPKKKTAIHAPANDAPTQEVGQTQAKYGLPKKKTVAAALEGQRRPSNSKVFDGVHIQARVQPSRWVVCSIPFIPSTSSRLRSLACCLTWCQRQFLQPDLGRLPRVHCSSLTVAHKITYSFANRNVANEAAVRPAGDPASQAAAHPNAVRSDVIG